MLSLLTQNLHHIAVDIMPSTLGMLKKSFYFRIRIIYRYLRFALNGLKLHFKFCNLEYRWLQKHFILVDLTSIINSFLNFFYSPLLLFCFDMHTYEFCLRDVPPSQTSLKACCCDALPRSKGSRKFEFLL